LGNILDLDLELALTDFAGVTLTLVSPFNISNRSCFEKSLIKEFYLNYPSYY
jgi:hypothetical protein